MLPAVYTLWYSEMSVRFEGWKSYKVMSSLYCNMSRQFFLFWKIGNLWVLKKVSCKISLFKFLINI